MFTWICPQCGREVPPSYSECPTCAENRAKGIAPGTHPPPPQQPQYAPPPPQQPQYPPQQPQYAPPQPQYAPPQPQYQPPPQAPAYAPQQSAQPVAPPPMAPPPPQPQYAPPQQQYAPPPPPPQAPPAWEQPQIQHSQPYYTVGDGAKKKTPAWLVMLGTAAVLGLGLFGLYRYVDGGSSKGADTPAAKKESAAAPGTHPYAKFVEITGLRLSEEGKKVKVQYLVVNHSAASLSGLELKVTLTTVNGKPEDPPIAEFTSKVGEVDAFGSKDVSEQISTKLRAYELPDWQFLKASFEITGPR